MVNGWGFAAISSCNYPPQGAGNYEVFLETSFDGIPPQITLLIYCQSLCFTSNKIDIS